MTAVSDAISEASENGHQRGSKYLEDDQERERLMALDGPPLFKTISYGTTQWHEWEKSAEFRKIHGFLSRFSEQDFPDGKVTLLDLCDAVYESDNDYFQAKVTGFLRPSGEYNKSKKYVPRGVVYTTTEAGTIRLGDSADILRELEVFQGLEVTKGSDAVLRGRERVDAKRRTLTRQNPALRRQIAVITHGYEGKVFEVVQEGRDLEDGE